MKKNQIVCWLFCTVIDNFGDIGITWRLAQELSNRLNYQVYLWVDQLSTLNQLLNTQLQLPCTHDHIHLRIWQEGIVADLNNTANPNIVIEMFACHLPSSVRAIIKKHNAIWLNWEYLSAEKWALQTHTMPSLQYDGTAKFFWQMGFEPASGGLLREIDYLQKKQIFDKDSIRRQQLRQDLNLPPSHPHTLEILIFAYSSPIWAKWFHSLRAINQPIRFLLAGQQVIDCLHADQFLPKQYLNNIGEYYLDGSLEWIRIPFLPQNRFDELLWLVDAAIIRGEDSFVRAQYAAKPFFWHIYPQQDLIHADKLHAFWKYIPFSEHINHAYHALSNELNSLNTLTDTQRIEYFQTLFHYFKQWQHHLMHWQKHLFTQDDAIIHLHTWLKNKYSI